MASGSTDSESISSILDQLGSSSLSPILIGLMGPSPDSPPDRVVLMNPVTQGMVVLRGDAATISEIFGGAGGGGGAPPASKASIEALKSVDSAAGSEDECSVCLDALEREEAVVKEMPCGHRFHGGCIEKWLKMHGSCPVCRFQMPIEDLKKEGEGGGREVWVTIAFRRSGRDEQQQHQQQQNSDGDDSQQREDS